MLQKKKIASYSSFDEANILTGICSLGNKNLPGASLPPRKYLMVGQETKKSFSCLTGGEREGSEARATDSCTLALGLAG